MVSFLVAGLLLALTSSCHDWGTGITLLLPAHQLLLTADLSGIGDMILSNFLDAVF